MKAKNQKEWLTLLRQRLGGISSKELGALVGASRMTAHRWHNPRPDRPGTPTLVQAVQLAALAGVSLEEVASNFGMDLAKDAATKKRRRLTV